MHLLVFALLPLIEVKGCHESECDKTNQNYADGPNDIQQAIQIHCSFSYFPASDPLTCPVNNASAAPALSNLSTLVCAFTRSKT